MLLHCIVKPSSRTDEIKILPEGFLRIKIKAPPSDGKANEYLVKFLAEKLSVSRSAIRILSGFTSSHKNIRVEGDEEMIRKLLQ